MNQDKLQLIQTTSAVLEMNLHILNSKVEKVDVFVVSQDTDDPQSYTNYKRLTRNGINTD
jgi:hypothetical protein